MSEMVCGPTFTDHSNSIGRVFFETLIFNHMIKNIPQVTELENSSL
jgi:hypothetical protein